MGVLVLVTLLPFLVTTAHLTWGAMTSWSSTSHDMHLSFMKYRDPRLSAYWRRSSCSWGDSTRATTALLALLSLLALLALLALLGIFCPAFETASTLSVDGAGDTVRGGNDPP